MWFTKFRKIEFLLVKPLLIHTHMLCIKDINTKATINPISSLTRLVEPCLQSLFRLDLNAMALKKLRLKKKLFSYFANVLILSVNIFVSQIFLV